MIGYQVKYILERDESGCESFAACPVELPGCMSQGDSPEEALYRLRDLLPLFLSSWGMPPPPAGSHPATEWVQTEWPWGVRPGLLEPQWLEKVSNDMVYVGDRSL